MILGYKLIDCLTGHSKLWKHLESTFNDMGDAAKPGKVAMLEMAAQLRKAEKFDFGLIPLEREGEGWYVPGLTDAEREAWRLKLIPLPAPVVWYEYVVGSSRTGILIEDEGDEGWVCRMVDFEHDAYSFHNVAIRIRRLTNEDGDSVFELDQRGNVDFFHWLQAQVDTGGKRGESAGTVLNNGIKPMGGLALYLTLMLMSRTTELEKAELTPAEKNANVARRSGNRAEIKPHTIVTIVPKRFIDRGDGKGGTHASPRLHWRRSHIRHYDRHTPGSTWAAEHEHQGKKGWWLAVIPRSLVGMREMGEVTHDYLVRAGD